ncbi:MAG: putative Ig domain-containing protein, partial [Isosphaeraceae bacterium]
MFLHPLSFGALPTGMTLDQNSGILSGTPAQTGQFSIVVQAQDTTGATASKLYNFTINVRPTIAGPNALPNWTVGQPYPPQTIVPQGGTPGYSNFKVVGGALPAGMTLDPVTGVISGTPTVAGPVNIQVQVQDAAGATVTTPYSFVVNSRPEIVQPQLLQNWTVGQPYPNTQVVLTNGTPAYSNYVVSAGALPAGMSLNQTTGLITGTPLQTGPFSLIIQAQDSAGAVASHSYLFTINVRPSIAGPSSLPNWTVGQPYPPQTIVPQGGTPGYSNFRIAA